MSNEGEDVVLFTGQSGIKISNCLARLIRAFDGFSNEPSIFSVEKEMQEVSGKRFLDILGDPPRIQETVWTKAFTSIKEKIPPTPAPDQYVFLTFHASYFHQAKREFLSPVDFRELTELEDRVRIVVVFIEDCYDIYRRLMQRGEMYASVLNPEKKTPQEALIASIVNLISILEWREIEIAFSRKIAQLLNAQVHVVAVKHPSRILGTLIASTEESKVYYLSHPISSIREARPPRISSFYPLITSFIERLLTWDNVVLYIPDAIDEKRIKTDRNTGKLIPERVNGWQLPFEEDEWLFTPLPAAVSSLEPLNPQNCDLHKEDQGFQSAVSGLLQILLHKIGRQINSRDRTLVEQSEDGVVVFRPYWAGVTPPGVVRELNYSRDLREDHGEEKRLTAVFCTEDDWAKWCVASLFTGLKNHIELDEECLENLSDLCQDWLNDPNRLREFPDAEGLISGIGTLRQSVEQVLPEDYRFDENFVATDETTLSEADMLADSKARDSGWQTVIDRIAKRDPLQEYTSKKQDVYVACSKKDYNERLEDFIKHLVEGGPHDE